MAYLAALLWFNRVIVAFERFLAVLAFYIRMSSHFTACAYGGCGDVFCPIQSICGHLVGFNLNSHFNIRHRTYIRLKATHTISHNAVATNSVSYHHSF